VSAGQTAEGTVLFVLKGYPRLSETFIAQEIRSLERAGMPVRIAALRRPTDGKTHPVHAEIRATVSYLPEYLHDEPWRVLKGLAMAAGRRGVFKAAHAFIRDLARDRTRNRVRRFGQACVLVAEMPHEVTALHAHFIHTPASVTRYAAMLAGLPFSMSAHAKDIWTSADFDLSDKLAEARFTVTCTADGKKRLDALSPRDRPVTLSYHGLDLDRFRPLMPLPGTRDGSDPQNPVKLLTVARAVDKKGLDTLLMALAGLPPELHVRWTHVGGGGLVDALKAQAAALGIGHRVAFAGSQAQEAVLAAYRQSDVFVLPCRIADDGDRDGLPNVLMEASSTGLPCISTPVGGVGELIRDGENGVLVPPDNADALAAAIVALARDPQLRHRLGKAASRRIAADFDHRRSVETLLELFGRLVPPR
jgi:glycosyltransferase involved in cell wall biosynthesis